MGCNIIVVWKLRSLGLNHKENRYIRYILTKGSMRIYEIRIYLLIAKEYYNIAHAPTGLHLTDYHVISFNFHVMEIQLLILCSAQGKFNMVSHSPIYLSGHQNGGFFLKNSIRNIDHHQNIESMLNTSGLREVTAMALLLMKYGRI